MKQPLEKHKFFPVVAWGLVIGFALFTYTLAQDLSDNTKALHADRIETTKALANTN